MSNEAGIRVEGLKEVQEKLGSLGLRFENMATLMAAIGTALVSSSQNRFQDGKAPDGQKWKPSLRAKLEGGQTLVDSGRLRDSVHFQASADRVEVGTNLIYAAVHQFGATIRPVNAGALHFQLPGGLGLRTVQEVVIPARPYVGFSEGDHRTVEHLTAQFADMGAPDDFLDRMGLN